MIPAFADPLAIVTPPLVTITITVDGDAAGTDPHIGLGQCDDVVGGDGSVSGGRQRHEAECGRKDQSKGFHEILHYLLAMQRVSRAFVPRIFS